MIIGALKERLATETRVALSPASAGHIQKLGHTCLIESGAGEQAGWSDEDYRQAGVQVASGSRELLAEVDIAMKVRPPESDEVAALGAGKTIISFFYPAEQTELMQQCAAVGVNVIAMDMVPRISRAQKMDALSSMANIAGYRAVLEAGNEFGRFFTGQVTAAGKVPPAVVLVIGAGVAGLAAIGTARSLGAVVRAFDVRPEVAEQIESMGAEFLMLDFDDQADGAETGGYAKPSSPEFREKQLALFREQAPSVDIVITTALIPGADAPKLWLSDMVAAMRPGSVVVDLAAERGGNCEETVADARIVTDNRVTVIGYTDLASRMATQSSDLYANNLRHMLADLTPARDGVIEHDMEDDVIRGATVVFDKEITYPPPAPKIQAIAKQPSPAVATLESAEDPATAERRAGRRQIGLLLVGAALMYLIGRYAPASFMQHFIVFVLSVFVGFQVIWNVSHALHTPLMAVTNAISGIIIIGALLQLDQPNLIVSVLAGISVLIATINIVGGFMVTRRMLQMFQRS